ncbi:RNA polymerase sigma factor SigI [Mycobacterium basiliense]|uniref:RNA polymerase sigma factor SigI n=1 Tax=Mycobacterium basiliense TaxID=2094119 RepID=A0A447GL68_9MYCO|nr:RNA polymerase sigma factor SigI [Mycobacterium basiliense]VDM91240.1 RNA polymerase sigma factor SigI [Mycobacterium basiliense]
MNHSQPPGGRIDDAWRRHRPYLINLGFQITADIGYAEDAAQEAFLRLARTQPDQIDDVRGWLTVVTSRICLDLVRSARARHEQATAIGPEVPDASHHREPADRVTLDEEIQTALLEVLRKLSPGERVAFVLHDVFGVPFDAIAQTVGRPAGTCRQLARRARAKFTTAQPKLNEVTSAEHRLVTEKFLTACANGDIDGLTAVLDPTVWGVGTILADHAPPPQVNHGPTDVAANLLRYVGPGVTLVSAPVGQPVLLAFAGRRLFAVIVLTIHAQLVHKIEATADPLARVFPDGRRRPSPNPQRGERA